MPTPGGDGLFLGFQRPLNSATLRGSDCPADSSRFSSTDASEPDTWGRNPEAHPESQPAGVAAMPAPSSGSDIGKSQRVRVRIIRPDGSYRDVAVAGHFREEHLCSLVDDELCHLATGETLTLHLFHPDGTLARSLRNRWQEGLSDNRTVHARGAGPERKCSRTLCATPPDPSADGIGGESEPGDSLAADGRSRPRNCASCF